jgi:hypothetical protein
VQRARFDQREIRNPSRPVVGDTQSGLQDYYKSKYPRKLPAHPLERRDRSEHLPNIGAATLFGMPLPQAEAAENGKC